MITVKMWKSIEFVLLSVLTFAACDAYEFLDVSLEQGVVRGFLSGDEQSYRFLGVPYATAQRFKAPHAAPTWSGTFEANQDVWCAQISFEGFTLGTEDCLVVNVYVPVDIQETDSLPVLVINHGGAYIIGSGSLDNFNINHPMSEGLIIVSYNYRVGAFGFLCLGTENAPGNAALKDQVAALSWIKSNIARFGGDPNDITVFGNSAGSGSLELLVLSEAAQGLFNKVVLESGSALNSWNVAYDPISTAKTAAELLGFPNFEDLEQLAEIFLNATTEELSTLTLEMFNSLTDTTFGFSPCIETFSDNFTILKDSPMNIIQSGHYNMVPLMVIYSDLEGLLRLPQWFMGWNTIFQERFEDLLPPQLSFESDEQRFEVAESIKQFYMDHTEDDLTAYLHFITDITFAYSIIHSSILHAENSVPVYLMEFSYHDEYNAFPGAGHGDFFTNFFRVRENGPVNEQVADRAKTMVVNFIKYNDPIPSTNDLLPVLWPTVTNTTVNYLSFNDQLTVYQSPIAERYQLWQSIYERYYKETPGIDADFLEISLEQGMVRGYLSEDRQSMRFDGIPYAAPPTGRNRFKAPLEPPSWNETLHATNSNVRCVQPLVTDFSEDCLIVNVYIPAGAQQNSSMPVFAINHGGGFFYGTGNQGLHDVNKLLAQEIILVSYNYRLGPLGFLCLGTENAPGNAGLKDQIAALRWIKNNIANFGGDPDNVTVFGYSAGAGSLEQLAISEAAEGLFNRVIIESGSALSSWAISYDPIGAAKSVANYLGFGDVDDLNTLEEIFINATPEELTAATAHFFFITRETSVLFGPCIESILDNSTVISDAPLNIIRSNNYNKVPIMALYTDLDGIVRLPQWETGWDTQFMEHFADFLPPDLLFDSDQERQEVAETIKQFYIDNTENDLLAYVDFMTDTWFTYSMIYSSELHAENSVPMYLMEFSFYDEHNPLPGAGHTDFFGHMFDSRIYGPANDLVVERAIAMITNFIKYNDPIPSTSDLLPVLWPTVTPTAVNYLAFNDQLAVRQSPVSERYQLWQSIYERYYKEPPGNIANFLEISLDQGIVRGYLNEDRQSIRFHGIPYAAPPTGRNRFKAPLGPPSWNGILHATNENVRCVQPLVNEFSEDCLIVNVYIPAGAQQNSSMPVFAINHGGGFFYGTGNQGLHDVNKLLAQEIILVSYNYRLGPLGFLCLGTENAPGNAGLKDQIAALRWIKNNIANFGGDPDNVTVFGYSAGAGSLEQLAISEAAEGLFNRVIIESGSALSSWAISYDPIGAAKSVANYLGFGDVDDLNTLEEIFINATPEELTAATAHFFFITRETSVLFGPCIESILDNSTVISDAPLNIIRSNNYNKVPIMALYTDLDGIVRLPQWETGWDTQFMEHFADFLPPDLLFDSDQERQEVAETIKQFYIDNTENDLLAYVDFMTDTWFTYSMIYSSELHAENSVPMYLMEFSFYDEHNPLPGAGHTDFFGHMFDSRIYGPANDLVVERAIAMITNFIKYNDPIPSTSDLLPVLWPTVTPTAVNYLAFNDQLAVRQSPVSERYQLWQSIYERYYKEPPGNIANFLEISLDQGIVRGYLNEDRQSIRFHGIPYAAPPTGRNRFKAPLGPPSWNGILHATNENVRCVQPLVNDFSEDCLIVNVYIPAGAQQHSSMPVFAINHGGGFFYGTGNQGLHDVNKLLSQDIILVSYNYRLGPLGFLCLGTENAPGNAGLKDQIAALRWIKNNIANFRGDPDNVTVFGYSAGAGSLEQLAISDAAEGLFNRVIIESGSALSSWAIAYDPIGAAKSVANYLGFGDVDNLSTLEEIFINATPEELNAATAHFFFMTRETSLLFGPCIESILDNSTVISDAPLNIIRSNNYNKVPIMALYTDLDGIVRLPQWETGWDTQFMEHFADFLPPDLLFDSDQERQEVAETIKQFYIDNTENDLLAYVDFMTDTWFTYSMIYSSELHAENSVPMYLMEFSFYDEHNPLPGAGHTDFFGHMFDSRIYGPANDLVVERAIAMITNFIKYNDPIPSTSDLLPVLWPTVTPTAVNYLAFNDQLAVRQSPVSERYQLWQSIYERYYKEPPGNIANFLEISLDQGIVRGYLNEDRQSIRFHGIPYAAPPTGRNRFKAPLGPPSWNGILHATNENVRCVQPLVNEFSEDCLIVNVYIPAGAQQNSSMPVFAINHGGGFFYGTGNQGLHDVNKLLAQEIILVSYNYRLGPLGFLCLGTENAPGNAGLKDQIAALRWIKNNIANFGGDPDNVTVFGYSAGAGSLEQLAISEAAEGLFNRVIIESGSALSSWAISYDPIGAAKSVANYLGFGDVDDLNTLEEIFINATPEELTAATAHFFFITRETSVLFGPCIESILDNSTVISDAPLNIIRSNNYNKVPIMALYTDLDGIVRLPQWETGWDTQFMEHFADFLPPDLLFDSDQERQEVAETIKQFYIDNTENDLLAYVDFMTDTWFTYSMIYSSELHAENSVPMYLMEFSFYDEHNPLPGAGHTDFFGHMFDSRIYGPANDLVVERAIAMITNFIKYNDPIPSTSDLLPVLWPTVTPTAVNYLAFNDQLAVRQSPVSERYQLWQSIYERYYKEPPGNIANFLEISLDQGIVRGYLNEDRQSIRFHGIPYAAPPTGRNRFKAPLGPPSWNGILHATNENVRCVQPLVNDFSEDCLIVNVYIPAGAQQHSSMPVFAINHGGGFFYGTGNQGLHDVNKLLSQDIILVSYNYRLGPLGFLCLGTENAPGNAGLKDQIAALRWIKNNIANFRGDPDNVTVFGYSAGAGSLEQLAISDAAEGLFNRVIIESGSALSSWAIAYDPIGAAKSVANYLGFGDVDNLSTLEEIFINATPEELNAATAHFFFMTRETSLLFGPCIESILDNSTVISDAPLNIIRSNNYNKVPIMALYTDLDGIVWLPQWETGWDTQFMEHFADFLPPDLLFDSDQERQEVAETIKQFYIDNTENDLLAYVDFMTDTWFTYSMINSSVLHAENSVPMYLMEFSFYDEHNPLPGAGHTDFFGHIFDSRIYGPANELVVERAIAMISNFIKYNDPIPSTSDLLPVLWPTVTPTAVNYLAFNDQLTVRQSPVAERYQFWRSIYQEHYRELQPEHSSGRVVGNDILVTILLLVFALFMAKNNV